MLSDDLVELQRLDTAIVQARRRHEQLTERSEHAMAERRAAELAERRRRAGERRAALETRIEQAEVTSKEIDVHRNRLQSQLKTVIVLREAEALGHELDVLKQRRDSLDDDELAALEEEAALDEELSELDSAEAEAAASLATATDALAAAAAGLDTELASLESERSAVAATLGPADLRRYDERRARFGGVAVATLDGRRCTGCNLELSVAEAGEVRAAGPITDCPQCGRLIIVA